MVSAQPVAPQAFSEVSHSVRVVGNLIMGAVLVSVFYADRSMAIWALLIFHSVVWPQLARYHYKHSSQPLVAESRNMFIGSFIIGMWGALMSFQLWPMVTMFLSVSLWSTALGGPMFLLRGSLALLLGSLFAGYLVGFHFQPDSEPVAIIVSIASFAFLTLRFATLTFTIRTRMSGLAAKISRYISPQVYASIFSGAREVIVETRRRELTVFFSDIKDFTAITDNTEPEVLSTLLNEYLTQMSRIALKHGGTIDKFIGDAVMIFFGDPETRGAREDALACVRMALEMRSVVNTLEQQWAGKGVGKPLRIRMGINTGYCTVGNFGSDERLDYTIVGGNVNLASRLESSAAPEEILISSETYSLIKDEIACVEIGALTVKGISNPVQTYHVIDVRENVQSYLHEIDETFDGFTLKVDLKQASASEVLNVLNRSIGRIKSAETYICEINPAADDPPEITD